MSVFQSSLIFIVGFLFCSGLYYAMESVLVYKRVDKYFYFVLTAFASCLYIFSQFLLTFPLEDSRIMIVHRFKLLGLIIALNAWVRTYYCEFFKKSRLPRYFLLISIAVTCTIPFPIFLSADITRLTINKFGTLFTYNFSKPGAAYSLYSVAIFLFFILLTYPKIIFSKLSLKHKTIGILSFSPGFVCFNDFLVSHKIIENIMLAEFAISIYVLSIFLIFINENIRNHKLLKNTLAKTKEYNEHLEKMVAERTRDIELKEEQKTNFFINLAHETKNPLTLVQNYIESYIKEKGADRKLEVIRKNIHKLTRDMVNFLDVEKLDREAFCFDNEKLFNLSKALDSKTLLFSEHAKQKKISFTSEIDRDLFIQADPCGIDRIVDNLIDNALKYTPEEGAVKIKAYQLDSLIHFTVRDNGPGIDDEMKEKVFLPYYQMNREKKNSQGIGMGLCIVKKIVDALGGSITINDVTDDDKNSNGTCFHVVLNTINPENDDVTPTLEIQQCTAEKEYPRKAAGAPQTNGAAAEKSNAKGKTILFVEDNPDLLYFLQISFSESYGILTAEDGLKAMEILESGRNVDLIVSDVMMDGMGGFEFMEKLSETPSLRTIPVIFLTAMCTGDDRLKGYKMGAVDFIAKPFSLAELSTRIESQLNNRSRQVETVKNDLVKYLQSGERTASAPAQPSMTNRVEQQCREYNLSKKEIEIVKLIFQNKEYKEIAYELKNSINTVNYHLKNIFQKIEVRSKSELIMKFMTVAG